MVIGAYFLWRANRAQATEPEGTVSQDPVFGPAPAQEAVAA